MKENNVHRIHAIRIMVSRVIIAWILVFAAGCARKENSIHLTPEEMTYIQSLTQPIIVAPCPDFPPIDFQDHLGNYTGLSYDYLEEIASRLNSDFIVAHFETWPESLQAAKERRVDIILSIQDVPQRHAYLNFTKPYVRIPNVIVTRKSFVKNLGVDDLKGLHVAAVRGYAVVDHVLKRHPYYNIELVSKEAEGLKRISFGEFDAMIVSLSTVSYFVDTHSIANLRIAGMADYDWQLCIGVRNDNPLLFSAITKALDSIPESRRRSIYEKWISLAPKPLYYEKKFWYMVIAFVSCVTFAIVGIMVWNAMLRRKVKIKTEQLSNELYWHKKTQDQLLMEKERLLITIQSIGDAFISTDLSGSIILANENAETLLGTAEYENKKLASFIAFYDPNSNRTVNPIDECVQSKNLTVYHYLKSTSGMRSMDISLVSSPIKAGEDIAGVATIIRDITGMMAMQKELIKLQQFESLGVLAAGIAHDFNNILTAIVGNAELLKFAVANSHSGDSHHIIDGIKKSVKSAQSLTSQLLTYAKGGKPVKQTGNIVHLLRDTIDFITHGSKVKVRYSEHASDYEFDYDENQLSHVFRNLALNAVQAIDESGVLTIKTYDVHVDRDSGLQLADGDYIVIQFIDTGKGVAQDNIDRIFEPYFTTKEKGSGLGLTTSLSIVKQHGGCISVSSSHEGAVFSVYLPKRRQTVVHNASTAKSVDSFSASILVMDDRDDIIEVVTWMLSLLGCSVESAPSGEEALSKVLHAKAHGKPYDCVLVDVTIPGGMSGVEAFKKMREIQPGMKGIVMSGYSSNNAIAEYESHGFSWFLEKPFTLDDIKHALMKALS